MKVYPDGFDETFCTDHWRARFMGEWRRFPMRKSWRCSIAAGKANLDFIKIENLYTFDGQKGFVARRANELSAHG